MSEYPIPTEIVEAMASAIDAAHTEYHPCRTDYLAMATAAYRVAIEHTNERIARLSSENRQLRDALENCAELLNVAIEKLGVCGEGDGRGRKADAEFPGGVAALHQARAALAEKETK